MRPHDLLRFFLLNGLAVGLGAVVASSCVTVNYPTIAFRCNPKQSENCPESHYCCSDDPAAEDGRLPAYHASVPSSRAGTPLFSGVNNGLSTTGMCVNLDDVPCDLSLGQPDGTGCSFPNCPIPCNPTWDAADISAVCHGQQCCQTVQLEPEDCVLEDGVWRPVTGRDIGRGGIQPPTQWRSTDHATHQDPNGRSCSTISGSGDLSNPGFRACVDQLTVANQRGFCMPVCPAPPPVGPDACELLNMGGVPPA